MPSDMGIIIMFLYKYHDDSCWLFLELAFSYNCIYLYAQNIPCSLKPNSESTHILDHLHLPVTGLV